MNANSLLYLNTIETHHRGLCPSEVKGEFDECFRIELASIKKSKNSANTVTYFTKANK